MKEYIEREAAIEAIKNLYPGIPLVKRNMERWHSENKAYFECESAIEKLPAADVRPVVKAEWVYTDRSRLVCSNCGNPVAFALKEDGWHHGDYCPNCGADMREES
jgi:hypothetical protein